jgi:hypothetical protein
VTPRLTFAARRVEPELARLRPVRLERNRLKGWLVVIARRRWAIFQAIFSSPSGPTGADCRLDPTRNALVKPPCAYCGDEAELS